MQRLQERNTWWTALLMSVLFAVCSPSVQLLNYFLSTPNTLVHLVPWCWHSCKPLFCFDAWIILFSANRERWGCGGGGPGGWRRKKDLLFLVYAPRASLFILWCLHFLWISPQHHFFTPVAARPSCSRSLFQLEVFPALAKVTHDASAETPASQSPLLRGLSLRLAGPLS